MNALGVDVSALPATLTVSQIQKLLGISRPTAYNLVNNEAFPVLRIGKKILIPTKAFLDWVDANTKHGAKK